MRTILELTDTKTDTAGIASITPEVWSADIEQQVQALRVARNFCKIDRSLVGVPGDVAHIMKGALLTTTSDVETSRTEAADVTFYALDDFATLDLTPAPLNSGVRISYETIEEVNVDVVIEANRLLAEVLQQYEDKLILSTVADTASINEVWGGDATAEASLNTGDIMTTDLFADAITEGRKDNFFYDVCFIHPSQENVFLKDSQFVNAAEYGGNEVVQNGEIGKYLGIKIISTTNVPANAPNTGTGHTCLMWKAGKGPCLAIKHDVSVETDRNVQKQAIDVVGRIKFAVGVLWANAVCKIEVTDA
jgi:N4-gp56 family major capsid protein